MEFDIRFQQNRIKFFLSPSGKTTQTKTTLAVSSMLMIFQALLHAV